ncbi:hypothetical protein M3891_003038 [Vibrio metschnikovii]|nr:hypothetical protein [Vibrio metschnikovii]
MSAANTDFTLRFNAETAQFQKDVDYAKKMLRGYAGEAKQTEKNNQQLSLSKRMLARQAKELGIDMRDGFSMGTTSALVFSAAVAGVTAGVVALYRSQAASIDETAKFAARIGISTENLTRYRHAAELSGVATKDFDTAMQRMTRRVSEAASGTGAAKSAIQELNLSAKDLNELAPEQQLQVIADAMNQVEKDADRLRLAVNIFDTGGAGMVNLLREGSSGLQDMANEADRLGITLNSVDAAKIEAANDAIYVMEKSISSLMRDLAINLAPSVSSTADGIGVVVNAFRQLNEQLEKLDTRKALMNFFTGTHISEHWSKVYADMKETERKLAEYDNVDVSKLPSINPFGKSRNEYRNLQVTYMTQNQELEKIRGDKPTPLLNNNSEPSNRPKVGQSDPVEDAKLMNLQKQSSTRLLAIDAQYASEREKFKLSSEQRIKDIQALNLTEKEIKDRGYENLESLQSDYIKREKAFLDTQLKEHEAATIASNNQRLSSFDTMYANDFEKLDIAHQERIKQIEDLKLSEFEVNQRGYDSLEQLKNSYMQRERDYYTQQQEDLLQRQDEAIQRELDAFNRKEEQKTQAAERQAEQRAATERRLEQQVFTMKTQIASQSLGLIAQAAKEGSKFQKAAFLAQKIAAAYTVYQQGEVAAMAALEPPPIGLGPLSGAGYAGQIRMMAGISAGMIMGQSLAGMAHSGISSVPREGTWLLDKGERVYTNDSAQKIDQMYSSIMSMHSKLSSQTLPLPETRLSSKASQNGSSGDIHQHFQFSALDARGMDDLILNHRSTIYNAVKMVKNDIGEKF